MEAQLNGPADILAVKVIIVCHASACLYYSSALLNCI